MLLNFDAAQLEWRALAHLSKDKVALEEINNKIDGHADNQKRFNLPSRLIAKVFLFRTIYCPLCIIDKSSYSFSVDNDFKGVGDVKYWRKTIEAFYDKYTGIRDYHTNLIQTAQTTGRILSETGRVYNYAPREYRGEWVWPISDIANYPVQGFSADLMALARVSAYRRLKESGALFINTVHDSITLDYGGKDWYNITIEMRKVFRDIPLNFERIYGRKLLVPMDCDAKVGANWLWMHTIKVKENA
jgi:DNA polymerase I-like protein with 3'-5' exonuclease and polymerase domains